METRMGSVLGHIVRSKHNSETIKEGRYYIAGKVGIGQLMLLDNYSGNRDLRSFEFIGKKLNLATRFIRLAYSHDDIVRAYLAMLGPMEDNYFMGDLKKSAKHKELIYKYNLPVPEIIEDECGRRYKADPEDGPLLRL